jgi:hypothetical protein
MANRTMQRKAMLQAGKIKEINELIKTGYTHTGLTRNKMARKWIDR